MAALGEELGLVGLSAILVCYLLLTARGLRTAIAAKDEFGSLLAGGLAFSLALQMFIVVGGVTRLIPLTGLTTPFLSYGGSCLLANYIILALLVRISELVPAPAGHRAARGRRRWPRRRPRWCPIGNGLPREAPVAPGRLRGDRD